MYKDVKKRILAGGLALLMAVSTLSVGSNLFANFVASADYPIESGTQIALVGTATRDYQKLDTASMQVDLSSDQSVSYSVSVYQNLTDASNPTSGVLRYSGTTNQVSGTTEEASAKSLNEAISGVYLSNGETYAVVYSFSDASDDVYSYSADSSGVGYVNDSGWGEMDDNYIDASLSNVSAGDFSDNTTLSVASTVLNIDLADNTSQIAASLSPALKRTITCTSSNSDVVNVTSNGALSPVASGTASVSVSAAGASNTIDVTVNVLESSITDGGDSYTYTGSSITPDLTVRCGSTTLSQGSDYTVSYESNTNVGTASATVTGRGNYAGYSKTINYGITEKTLTQDSGAQFSVNPTTGEVTNAIYSDGEKSLTLGRDFTASATANGTSYSDGKLVYNYNITLTGTGNYTGTVTYDNYQVSASAGNKFDISQIVTVALYNGSETVENNPYTYDGSPKEPTIVYTNAVDNNVIDGFGANCTVEYRNNTSAGSATVVISGKEAAGYTGTIEITFDIYACNLETAEENGRLSVSASLNEKTRENFSYTGSAIRPSMSLTLDRGGSIYTLVEGADYTVSYSNNTAIGTMTVSIESSGTNFTGSITKEYQIIGNLETDASVTIGNGTAATTYAQGYASAYSATYSGKEITPAVAVKLGKSLKEGSDYSVSYENNTDAGTATVVITGKGNYADKVLRASFTIKPASLTGTLNVTADKTYTGSAITLSSDEYTLKQTGRSYVEGKDYELSYENNTDAGTARVIAKGSGNYTGSVSANFTIDKLNITDEKVSVETIGDRTYTGNAIRPEVTLYYTSKNGEKSVIPSSNYSVEYADNKNIGTATVTIKGKNNLTDSREENFTIVAKSLDNLSFTMGGQEVRKISENTYVADYSVEYTGLNYKASALNLVVKDGATTLAAGSNTYKLSIKNAKNAGSYDETKASACPYLLITGQGNYKGSTITIYFNILPKDISDEDSGVSISQTGTMIKNADGSRYPELNVVFTERKATLALDTDYTITVGEDSKTSGEGKIATVTGIGNYSGSRQITYTIGDNLAIGGSVKLLNPYNDNVISTASGTYYVPFWGRDTDGAVAPKYSISYNKNGTETDLVEDQDYTVSIVKEASDTMGVCEHATITITGIGDYYGTITREYYVTRLIFDNKTNFKLTDETYTGFSAVYNGNTITPNIKITFKATDDKEVELISGTDYTVSTDPVGPAAGSYTVTITGTGYCSGTMTQTYTIAQDDLGKCTASSSVLSDQTYTGKAIRPTLEGITITNSAGATLVENVDYRISAYTNNTNIADKNDENAPTVTIQGIGNYTGSKTFKFSIVAKNIADNITIGDVPEQIYTGSQLKPSLSVLYGDIVLTEGTDYDLTYSNNVNPGKATVTITGKGAYTGTKLAYFNIVGDLSDTSLFAIDGCKASYNLLASGKLDFSSAGINIKFNGSSAAGDGSIQSQWLNSSNYEIQQVGCSEPGEGQLVFVGKNYCRGSQSVSIKVIGDLANAQVINVENQYDYTGKQIGPNTIVQFGSKLLTQGSDYTLTYGDNINVGNNSGSIYISAVDGSYYTGSKTQKFNIYYNLANANITLDNTTYNYNGNAITPTPTVSVAGKTLSTSEYSVSYENNTDAGTASVVISGVNGKSYGQQAYNFTIRGVNMSDSNMAITVGGMTDGYNTDYTGDAIQPEVIVSYAGKVLTQTKQYNLSYTNNTNAGTASVTISGIGSYIGSVTKTFTINQKDISSTDVTAKVSDAGYAGGNGVTPQMSLTFNGKTLQQGTDYSYVLSNNTAVSTADSKAAVTFTGSGNFKGSRIENFLVKQVDLAGGTVKLDKTEATYTGNAITPKVEVSCPVGDGTTYILQEGTDYTIAYGNGSIKDAGNYNISITGINNFYGQLNPTFTVEAKALTDADLEYTIDDAPYTGSAMKPNVTITNKTSSEALVEGKDYTITYKNNVNSGAADDEDAPTAVISGIGNYQGTKELTFNIGVSIKGAQVRIPTSQQTFTYDGKSHIPSYEVYLGETRLIEGTDYELVAMEDSINAGTKTLTVKGIGNYYGKPFATYTIAQKIAKASEILVTLEFEQDEDGNYITTYSGQAIEPKVHVYDTSISTTKEIAASNYTITYENNEVISSADSPAYIKVSLKGNYALGSETSATPFYIKAKNISDFEIKMDSSRVSYTGEAVTPAVSVLYDNGSDPIWTLQPDIDYTVKYENNTKAGTATVSVSAKGNYTGKLEKTFTIVASLSAADVTVEPQFYTGKLIEPPMTVICGGNELEKDVDYKADFYSDDGYTTGGYAILTPLSSCYSDSIKVSYTISSDVTLLKVKGYANQYPYTGEAIKPSVKVVDPSGNEIPYDEDKVVYTKDSGSFDADVDLDELVEDDCIEVGTYRVYIPVDLGNESTVLTAVYEIIPKNINACTIIQLSKNTYTGKAIEPKPTLLYDDRELIQDTEYTVVYANNVNPGVATATVTGIGNYTGSCILKYNIVSPAMVGTKASSVSETAIKLTWLKNGKATGYEIYSVDNSTKYGETTGTSFTVENLKSSTTYEFHVRSYVTVEGKTSYGQMVTVQAHTKVSSTNGLTGASSAKKTAVLNWDRSTTVGGYEIYRSNTVDGTYRKIATVPNGKGTYTDTGVASGRTYYYKVRAYKPIDGSYVYGDFSKTITITVK